MIFILLLLVAAVPSSSGTFFNMGCGCPPPPPCPPPIQLPQLCLPRFELPQISTCNPCGRKKRTVSSENGLLDFEKPEVVLDQDTCNHDGLKGIMIESMYGSPQEAKIRIAENAEESLGGHFTVICSSGSFSYLSTTSIYCLQMRDNLNCYAFQTDSSPQEAERRRHRRVRIL